MNKVEEKLKTDGKFIGKTKGDSMKPMLVGSRDTVIVVPPVFPLKKYDVPVYRRDDHYTMHRIIRVTKNGYEICGDNRTNIERDIKDEDIVGVLYAFYNNSSFTLCTDKKYLRYAQKICFLLPFKILLKKLKTLLKKILNKKN